MVYLLGIDLGTSGTKTVLFDQAGRPVSAHTVEYPLYQPQNGWAEQNPEDWWQAAKEGIQKVLASSGISPKDIAGVGLSGQMHGLTMLNEAGEVQRPAIIWCDQRTGAQCAEMSRRMGDKEIIRITANPPMTGFTAAKILWVKQNQPDLYKKCAHILLPKDYLRFKLTGEFATEVSDASGMQLMDVPGRRWSPDMLSMLDISESLLPSMHESPDLTGAVHEKAARETGLLRGTPVVGGAGDNAAAAVGTGVVREGRAFTTLGTSGVVYALSNNVSIDPMGRVHTLCASVPGKWTVMSCTQAAGLSLRWLRDTCCAPESAEAKSRSIDPYQVMGEEAEKIAIGAENLLYLPYLMGERSPHPDPDCRGVFFGLSAIHGRAHLTRAVMEGVAYSQAECVDVFREMKVPIREMMACGGGARSTLWRQMLADLYNCPVSTLHADEGPALGVAILAGVGTGVYKSVEAACDEIVKTEKTLDPIPQNNEAYQGYYALYKKLYQVLKPSYKELSKLGK